MTYDTRCQDAQAYKTLLRDNLAVWCDVIFVVL